MRLIYVKNDITDKIIHCSRNLVTNTTIIFALFGSGFLATTVILTCYSIFARTLGHQPVVGDFEIVQLCLAISVASFLPYCQANGGNIIVGFFTSQTKENTKNILDNFGKIFTFLVLATLAWRTGIGTIILRETQETTMILGIPIWWSYALMTPSLALASIVALLDVTPSGITLSG